MSHVSRQYTVVAKALHWLMALAILSAIVVGMYASYFVHFGVDTAETHKKLWLITLHKSIATTTLFLIVARVLWRLTHRPPELQGMRPLMRRAAHLGHLILYALMIIVPVVGWADSSSAGYPIPVLGLFTIPPLMHKGQIPVSLLDSLHEYFAWALTIVVAGHILMALKHKFVDNDGILEAMLPGRGRG